MKQYEFLREINHEMILKHLKYLSSFEKLSGSKSAGIAAHYILNCLDSYRIDCHLETFDGFFSNPVESSLEVIDENVKIKSRPRSFSRSIPEGITGELVYDSSNINKNISDADVCERMKKFRGKIVVSHGFDERYAKQLENSGVLALIQIWTSKEDIIHEDTVSGVWGTPTRDTSLLIPSIPVVGITYDDGERLIEMLKNKEVRVKINTCLDIGVFPCEMPVAEIKGNSEDFILMSCHYDTWYLGAFDNCAANAAAIEIAKVLHDNKDKLKRSIKIVWWAGHSNGRYAGSAWYNDNHFFELSEHCFAHVTADLLGAKGCNLVGIRTTGVEGYNFLKENANLVDPGVKTLFFPIGRGADQSFWGANIPIHFYTRYEKPQNLKDSDSPGPGVYWWHTEDDTYGKVDPEVYRKDVELYFLNIYRLLTDSRLPFAPHEYFNKLISVLSKCNKDIEGLSCEDAVNCIKKLEENTIKALTDCTDKNFHWVLKIVGGNMNRISQSCGSPYDQDLAFSGAPIFPKLMAFSGKTKENVSSADYVFLKTDFIRQNNRIISEVTLLNKLLADHMEKRILS